MPGDRRARRARARRRTRWITASASLVVVAAVVSLAAYGLPWRAHDTSARAEGHGPHVAPSTTTASTAPPDPLVSSAIVRENQLPGTRDWQLTDQGRPGDIEGYAGTVSAQQGDTVTLFVSTRAPSFKVEAYRIGWYQGLGGRLVWTSADVPGHQQAKAVVTSPTDLIEARWDPSLQVHLDASWTPGDYLFKLVASTGPQQWVPLTVRDDASHAAYMVMNAVTDWQAYNTWGGCSLYVCPGGDANRGVRVSAKRAEEVSFDRPYLLGAGAGDFPGNEMPLVWMMEQNGFDVTYTTSIDLDLHPELVLQHKALLSLGHDEYWSKPMFDAAQNARDHGVNLAFFGANAIYRQIRLVDSPLGPARRQINYRSTADPIRRVDPSLTTVSWRESPVNRPEQTLIGEQYECNPVRADLVVSDASSWVYAGTGLKDGDHVPITVGTEYDRFDPNVAGPRNVEVLAHSPVRCHGRSSYADVTYYSAPSGAGVFASGTNWWISKLNPPGPGNPHEPMIIAMTLNVLRAFGLGPAGVAHPSVANWEQLPGIHAYRGNAPTTSTTAENN
jgi:hypothetical protein